MIPRAALALVLLTAGVAGPAAARGQERGATPLAADVERAIGAGTGWLRLSLSRDPLGPVSRGYPLGSRALVAYALLEAGVGTEDPLVRRLFQEMAALEHAHTYDVALYVLALHSWKLHGVPVVTERPDRTEQGNLVLPDGKSVRAEMARSIEWLIAARLRGAGTWGYGPLVRERDPWTDFSNTQFAALALHVGELEGFAVPAAVFEELAQAFSMSALAGPDAIEITVDRAPWLAETPRAGGRRGDGDEDGATSAGAARLGSAGVRLTGRPISWGYRPIDPRQRRAGAAGWGTLSMTSAAVSSLLVAEAGLAAHGGSPRKIDSALDPLVTGGVIELSRAWRPLVERVPGSMHRNIYYTLYSFEKAMDLAGIRVLDGLDWYRLQVPELLTAQHPSGAWGAPQVEDDHEYQRMATCFALLFLRRATASLTVYEAGPIITHAGEESGPGGVAAGRVLVPSLGGLVDLDDLFLRLEANPTRELLGIAAEAIASAPPDERPEMLRWLIPLREKGGRGGAAVFAREQAAALTGLPADAERAALDDWLARWRRLGEISRAEESGAAGEIAAWLADVSLGTPLRIEITVTLLRLGALEAMPALVALLDDPDPAVRAAGHRAARDLTLADLPFDAEAPAATRSSQATAWRFWWDTRGAELILGRRFEALRQRLERAEDPDERAALRADLAGLGQPILPRIERIIATRSYAFDWLLVREALTGVAGVR